MTLCTKVTAASICVACLLIKRRASASWAAESGTQAASTIQTNSFIGHASKNSIRYRLHFLSLFFLVCRPGGAALTFIPCGSVVSDTVMALGAARLAIFHQNVTSVPEPATLPKGTLSNLKLLAKSFTVLVFANRHNFRIKAGQLTKIDAVLLRPASVLLLCALRNRSRRCELRAMSEGGTYSTFR